MDNIAEKEFRISALSIASEVHRSGGETADPAKVLATAREFINFIDGNAEAKQPAADR